MPRRVSAVMRGKDHQTFLAPGANWRAFVIDRFGEISGRLTDEPVLLKEWLIDSYSHGASSLRFVTRPHRGLRIASAHRRDRHRIRMNVVRGIICCLLPLSCGYLAECAIARDATKSYWVVGYPGASISGRNKLGRRYSCVTGVAGSHEECLCVDSNRGYGLIRISFACGRRSRSRYLGR